MPAETNTPAQLERGHLRQELRARRASLSAAQRVAAMQGLLAQLERLPEFLTDRLVGGYWAIHGELPLAGLMPGLRARGQIWHLPVLGADRRLRFAAWQPGDGIAPNRYGIPEPLCRDGDLLSPAQLDLVLLPLLGFDRRGNRLGFGGGWYDRSFAFLRNRAGAGKPLLVGVGYAMQEVAAIEAMPWDVRLDCIATERELIDLAPSP
ncbi:5-formyltetrahydrofolate cyclo-ligase [Dokdonella sp.]|uniref:5-formyltetrahydrofolate cyclo-ligase n=1 Tax=Dokdonella sp. TaxID=2291710 RepID=UPI0031C1ECF2|nr:5-formyltetrahydrofolate cyclo-ligase [Dokdonella sp.]